MRTRRWVRSPRGKIFGVVTGLAEWRGLDPGMTRLIVFLIVLFTGVFPGIAIYLALALILPPQADDDIAGGRGRSNDDTIYAEWEEAETSAYDKEKDWDERFRNGK